MALYVCLDCTAAYPTDMKKCPQCGSSRTRFDYEEPGAASPAPAKASATCSAPSVPATTSDAAAAGQPTTGKASS